MIDVAKTNLTVVKDMVRRAYHGFPQEDNVTLIGSSPSSIISMSPCGNEYDGDDEGEPASRSPMSASTSSSTSS